MQSDPDIEFSRILPFDQIDAAGVRYHIRADKEECLLLAQRFNLVALDDLKAEFFLASAQEPDCYTVEGNVSGQVTQSCVVTLKEVPTSIEVSFHILLRPSTAHNPEKELEINIEDKVDTEYYTVRQIDLGNTAAEYLYLKLDPFPRFSDAPPLGPDFVEKEPGALAQALKKAKLEEG